MANMISEKDSFQVAFMENTWLEVMTMLWTFLYVLGIIRNWSEG